MALDNGEDGGSDHNDCQSDHHELDDETQVDLSIPRPRISFYYPEKPSQNAKAPTSPTSTSSPAAGRRSRKSTGAGRIVSVSGGQEQKQGGGGSDDVLKRALHQQVQQFEVASSYDPQLAESLAVVQNADGSPTGRSK